MKYLIILVLLVPQLWAQKVVFLHGGRSHGAGQHEYKAGSYLLADQLKAQKHSKISTLVISGWPEDESVLDDADAIVLYNDSSKIVDKGLTKINSLWEKGTGIMMMHYAVHPKKNEETGEKYFLPWIGGYFKNGKSVNPIWKANLEFNRLHPISKGVGKVEAVDEWYFNMQFSDNCQHVAHAKFCKENLVRINNIWNKEGFESENKNVTLMWAVESGKGARGVGFTGGHYHKNWAYDNYRKAVLNAIMWTAKIEIPETGADLLPVTEETLSANTDDNSRIKLPTDKDINFKPGKFETPAEQTERMRLLREKKKNKKTNTKSEPTENSQENSFSFVDSQYLKPHGDLEVKLWAKSPMLMNPTNMDTDAQGRIWVTEGVNYRRKFVNRRKAGDRVVILEDTDGDGTADSSRVFVEDPELVSPLGIAVFDNRIIISQPPNLIAYIDVNRDLKFDPAVDKKEIIVSGFNGQNHDHSLHAVISSPDGRWMVNQGNCGAEVKDRNGRVFYFGGSYKGGGGMFPHDPFAIAGKISADGHIYSGGFIASINPDGSEFKVEGYNFRNSYEHTINSLGEIFQSDNDDTISCRVSHVPEYGNAGYFSRDGKRDWRGEKHSDQELPLAHWHQYDPGFMPAGDIYGSGSPTGVAFYENGALGKEYDGMLLAAEAAKGEIFGYFPEATGAGYKLKRFSFLIRDKTNGRMFRPSDVMVGADGAIYVCDWFDPGVGGHGTRDDSLSGAIYRIAPKGFKSKFDANINYSSVEGLLSALKSPAINVRNHSVQKLQKLSEEDQNLVLKELKSSTDWYRLRLIWILPYLGKEGLELCIETLRKSNMQERLVAYRALRSTGRDMLAHARAIVTSSDSRILREISASIRDKSFEETKEILYEIYKKITVDDDALIFSFGVAAEKKRDEVWNYLNSMVTEKNQKFNVITRELQSKASLLYLKSIVLDINKNLDERKYAAQSIVYIDSKQAPLTVLEMWQKTSGGLKEFIFRWGFMRIDGDWAKWNLRERFESSGFLDAKKDIAESVVVLPKTRKVPPMKEILKLQGNSASGKMIAQRCKMCHIIEKEGVDYGPGLDGWAVNQSREEVLKAVLDPLEKIAHGFSGKQFILLNGKKVDGLVIDRNDLYVKVKSAGGLIQDIPLKDIKNTRTARNGLMYFPETLGLSKAQEFADLAEYLQSLK